MRPTSRVPCAVAMPGNARRRFILQGDALLLTGVRNLGTAFAATLTTLAPTRAQPWRPRRGNSDGNDATHRPARSHARRKMRSLAPVRVIRRGSNCNAMPRCFYPARVTPCAPAQRNRRTSRAPQNAVIRPSSPPVRSGRIGNTLSGLMGYTYRHDAVAKCNPDGRDYSFRYARTDGPLHDHRSMRAVWD